MILGSLTVRITNEHENHSMTESIAGDFCQIIVKNKLNLMQYFTRLIKGDWVGVELMTSADRLLSMPSIQRDSSYGKKENHSN